MKKLILLILALAIAFAFTSCVDSRSNTPQVIGPKQPPEPQKHHKRW